MRKKSKGGKPAMRPDPGDAKSILRRREFLGMLAAGAGSAYLLNIGCDSKSESNGPSKKLIYIALDSIHPGFFSLDARGMPGGVEGNYLMPNINRFIKQCVWYPNATSACPPRPT